MVMRRRMALAAGLASALTGFVCAPARATAPYTPITPPLVTPWTSQVSRVSPLPDYPRPELQRSRWMSLNGQWQYEAARPGGPAAVGRSLAQTILVPFPVEAPLSGIGRQDQMGFYRREFTIPTGWGHDHVLLHFGAVSWLATVYVNGRLAGRHRGDYDAFTFDITHLLRRGAANELVVGFQDPVGGAGEPVGKQSLGSPAGILHSPASGIWQTVWLEPVAAQHIDRLILTPHLDRDTLEVAATVAGAGPGALSATAVDGSTVVASASATPGRAILLHIPHPIPWTPWKPFLYGLRLALVSHGHLVDSATSYFGMRSVTLGRVGGATRILLNGKFVFQAGALDQGYWPDGVYTPPSDAAIRFDIQRAKAMGFDMLREHQKVQPDRWYYWADRLGLLVWQDMPSLPMAQRSAPSPSAQAEFRRELARIVTQQRSHPSIVVWVPFNEGWGQFDPGSITRRIKQLDPSALVDSDSGSADCCAALESADSDMRDSHMYSGPFAVAGGSQASVIGEYGGVQAYPPPGHRWPGVLTSVGSPVLAWGPPTVIPFYLAQYAELAQELRSPGISAAVLTEFANYEQELGILTYDRRVSTLPVALFRNLNRRLLSESERISSVTPQPGKLIGGVSGSWSFAEGTGTSAADSSPRGQTMSLSGGTGWASGPRIQRRPTRALSFTGAGDVAQTVAPVIDTAHSFTVSAWLRSGQSGQSGSAVSQPGPDGSSFSLGIETAQQARQAIPGLVARHLAPVPFSSTQWTFMVPAQTDCTSAQCGVRANLGYADSRLSIQTGRWYQVTGVYDTGSQTIALYVDGLPQDVEHVFAVPPAEGPLTVGQGEQDYAPSDNFVGQVAQLRTYARALSPGQVWQLYRAQSS